MRTLSECPPETLRCLTAVLCDMVRQHWRSPQQRKQDQAKLKSLAMRILKAVPGADIASDQAYRDTDLAIDFRENVAPLEMEQVERVVRMFKARLPALPPRLVLYTSTAGLAISTSLR